MNEKKKVIYIVAALIVLILATSVVFFIHRHSNPLANWQEFIRNPQEMCVSMKSTHEGLELQGDFDADGKKDIAQILKNKNSLLYGVWVTLSSQSEPVLAKNLGKELSGTAIRLVKPGIYPTACGKGFWPCKEDEIEKVHLKNATIDVVHCQSADFLLIWRPKLKKFFQMWMSD
jgi:hypothetical protein